MKKRRERRTPRLTPKQRRALIQHINDLRISSRSIWMGTPFGDATGTGVVADAILVALAELADHRRFRKERSKRR